MGRSSRTIYVGNLPGDIREREVEDLFYKYGRIIDIDLKIPPRPPGYAFIEYEDNRDAEDAIYARDGYDFFGHKLRVELAHGGRGHSSSIDRYSSHSSAGYRGGVSRRSDYRVLVSGLPSSASWQDLKDHMRRAGDVCFSQVFREGRGTTGIVNYTNYEDMKYAIRKLDRSEFRNAFSRAVIKVREYDSSSPTPRSLSCSPRSRSPISSDSARRSSTRSLSKSKSRRVEAEAILRKSSHLVFVHLGLNQDPFHLALNHALCQDHVRDPDPPLLLHHTTNDRAEASGSEALAGAYPILDPLLPKPMCLKVSDPSFGYTDIKIEWMANGKLESDLLLEII